MKTICCILSFCFLSLYIQAQETETTITTETTTTTENENRNENNYGDDYRPYNDIRTISGNKKNHHGAYIGILSKYSRINGEDAILVGGKFGYLMNHSFGFGIGGYGLISEYQGDYLTGGYGGFIFEPIILPKFPVHISLPVLLGGGAVTTFDEFIEPFESIERSDVFAVIEPGVNIEINVTKFFRLGLGGSYRFTTDINEDIFEEKLIEGWSTGISLTFGRF